MSRLRVSYCLSNSGIGGTELNAVRTAERLDPDRYDLEIISFNDYAPLRERYERAGATFTVPRVHGTKGSDLLRRGIELAKHLFAGAGLIRSEVDASGLEIGEVLDRAFRLVSRLRNFDTEAFGNPASKHLEHELVLPAALATREHRAFGQRDSPIEEEVKRDGCEHSQQSADDPRQPHA